MQDIVYKLVPGLQEGKCHLPPFYDPSWLHNPMYAVKILELWLRHSFYWALKQHFNKICLASCMDWRRLNDACRLHWLLSFSPFLPLLCSGDKKAEGLLSEVGNGGAWRHQRRALQHEDSFRSAQWYDETHTFHRHRKHSEIGSLVVCVNSNPSSGALVDLPCVTVFSMALRWHT